MKKFMRTRSAAPPPPHHAVNGHAARAPPHPLALANGHANGVSEGVRSDDHHSTVSSRYWSGSGVSAAGAGGAPWEDPEFPACWRSIGDKRLAANVLWMRPHELCSRPEFSGTNDTDDNIGEDFAARWRVEVGEFGDGGVCAAAAALALTPRLLARVAPPHSFGAHYTGLFRFRLWVFGAWREVCVDDRLPTRGGRLLASRCSLPADFTLPLLEKAYAKLYGSYMALRGGSTARALQDLTGGIVQSFALAHQPRALTFQVLNSAVPRSSLLVATAGLGARARTGLLAGQPYCVTGLARVRGEPERALVRLRAPSGRGQWAGAADWRALPEQDRELLAARAANPGEFWMCFSEFARWFERLELVHVGPDDWMCEPALRGRRPWRAVLARRRWRAGYNAGGPPRCDTATANPQFHVQVPRKCHVVVSVTQQYVCGVRERLRAIGFAVYEAPAEGEARAALRGLRALDVTHESRAREVVTFFTLPAGDYLVVPHTRRPHSDAAFLLRILTDEQTNIWEVNEDNVIIRNISSELLDDRQMLPAELRATLAKLLGKDDVDEVDAWWLRTALRRVWRAVLVARPSLELCRALVMLRDAAMSGRMSVRELPALLAALADWRLAFLRCADSRRGRCAAPPACSSYRLRALLRAAGVSASNKVLECLVLRFARRRTLTHEAYVMALARLHLAHERYRSLDTKMKSNPLSLEEMILMTIYS